jgi:hypothetical protein
VITRIQIVLSTMLRTIRSATPKRRRRGRCGLVVVVAAALLATPSFAAQGGATISAAPTLAWGQVQTGAGGNNVNGAQPLGYGGSTFWRLRIYTGDQITGSGRLATSNGCATDRIVLYGPQVTDATLPSAKPLISAGTIFQNSCVSLKFSWLWSHIRATGLATLWAAISSEAPTFTFVAHARHRTEIRLGALAKTLPPAARVELHAKLDSAAGIPSGSCAFDRRADGRGWQQLAKTRANNGACSTHIQNDAKNTLQIRVRFLPAADWLSSAATTPRIQIG